MQCPRRAEDMSAHNNVAQAGGGSTTAVHTEPACVEDDNSLASTPTRVLKTTKTMEADAAASL